MPATGTPLGSPFGAGLPTAAPAPALGAELSRYIDPANGTYVINPATGRYGGMPIVRQRVVLALRHREGTSTAIPEGIKWPTKQTPSMAREIEDTVRKRLFTLTDVDKLATLDAVLTEVTSSGRVQVTVEYTDLTTNQADTYSFQY